MKSRKRGFSAQALKPKLRIATNCLKDAKVAFGGPMPRRQRVSEVGTLRKDTTDPQITGSLPQPQAQPREGASVRLLLPRAYNRLFQPRHCRCAIHTRQTQRFVQLWRVTRGFDFTCRESLPLPEIHLLGTSSVDLPDSALALMRRYFWVIVVA